MAPGLGKAGEGSAGRSGLGGGHHQDKLREGATPGLWCFGAVGPTAGRGDSHMGLSGASIPGHRSGLGADPVSWTRHLLGRGGRSRCHARDRRTLKNSAARWWSWFGPDGHPRNWAGSSSRARSPMCPRRRVTRSGRRWDVRHAVAKPEHAVGPPRHRLEGELLRRSISIVDVEERRRTAAAVGHGCEEEAHLVDQPRAQHRPVDVDRDDS